jgi:uncharacterized BrkB/YihY/UPF0761 family membrane protein
MVSSSYILPVVKIAHINEKFIYQLTISYICQTNESHPPSWSRTLIAIAITFVTLATIAFLLRLFSRVKISWKPAIEDLFLRIGLLFSYLLSTYVVIGAFRHLPGSILFFLNVCQAINC